MSEMVKLTVNGKEVEVPKGTRVIEAAKKAIDTVAAWASTRKLDYTIETVFKKWLELDRLKPKEAVKKPF